MEKSALVLVDFINEIVDEKGKLAGKGYAAFVKKHDILTKVQTAVERAHVNRVPVIFVNVSFRPDYSDWPEDSPLFGAAKKFGALQSGTWATELHSAINRGEDDYLVTKNRVSAFRNTALEAKLKELGVETLLIGGVATDLAVQSTVRDAHDRDFKVVILKDLCGAANDEDHESALKLLSKVATISNSSEVEELR
ncbi:MAG: cysteine hydrolase [Patescibacteria group bacterium]|nr:cysteine hydrolase [Patescibacteria group bacterium]